MRDNIYVRLGIPVVLVCMIAAAGLAVTYGVTRDRIAAQDAAAIQRSLLTVLPDAADFEAVTETSTLLAAAEAAGDVTVDGIYLASDDSGQPAGTGILVGSRGYGGPIRIAVGVDRNGKVAGVSIVAMNETPGLGTKIVDDATFLPRFAGLGGADEARKLDTITGATKSSRGVRNGVEAALAAYAAIGSGGGGSQ
jgi:electron transport complex protein RnfG